MSRTWAYHILTRIRPHDPHFGSVRDQVHTLARRGVSLTPPGDIDYDAEDVELSGVGVIDLAAGDDQYVFLTPFGTVVPLFKGSFDKPVLAYDWDYLREFDALLRAIDLESFYLRVTQRLHEQIVRDSDNIFDAASVIQQQYGEAFTSLQQMAQVPASVAMPLMWRLLHADPHSHHGDSLWHSATQEIYANTEHYDFERAATVAEYLEPSHITWDEDTDEYISEINEFQGTVASELTAASEELDQDRWPNMLQVMLDADPSALARNPQKFWAGHNSPELLLADALPVCEAVAFYIPSEKQWYRMPAHVCAEGREAVATMGALPLPAYRA